MVVSRSAQKALAEALIDGVTVPNRHYCGGGHSTNSHWNYDQTATTVAIATAVVTVSATVFAIVFVTIIATATASGLQHVIDDQLKSSSSSCSTLLSSLALDSSI